jgi:hypothetical protein
MMLSTGNRNKRRTQVIKASVKFWGQERDSHGMPDSYRSYFVLSSPWQDPDSGVASVFCISGAEQPPQRNVWVEKGGERAAYNKAVATLKLLPENSGLKCREDEG